MIEQIPNQPLSSRAIYFCASEALSNFPTVIQVSSSCYVLFIAMNFLSESKEQLLQFAESHLNHGMVYCCAWGEGCELFHDLVDEEAWNKNEVRGTKSTIMTTWHAQETLEEALWFSISAAFPDNEFDTSCSSVIVAIIGNQDQAVRAKSLLGDLETLEALANKGNDA